MNLIDIVSRIVHVSTAIALVGGSVFMLCVLLPAASQLSTEEHDKLRGLINARWKKFVHIGIALLLITGLYNFIQALPNHKGDGTYHALLGTKMLIALVVFFIASALVGRSPKFEAMRQNRAKWLGIVVLLAAIIVAISGYAKVRGNPVKAIAPQVSTGY